MGVRSSCMIDVQMQMTTCHELSLQGNGTGYDNHELTMQDLYYLRRLSLALNIKSCRMLARAAGKRLCRCPQQESEVARSKVAGMSDSVAVHHMTRQAQHV